PPPDVTTYRDPYVWRTHSEQADPWRMIVGAGLRDGRGAALLYTSPDLGTWTYRCPLHQRADEGPGIRTGEAWECPQLAAFPDGRVLLITSSWYQRTGPAQVAGWAGTTDGERHHFADPFRLDHGPDFYAPALLHAPDGRWLLWGWSWEARDERAAKEAGWAGVLTLPREITLTPDGRTRQTPARELEGLRTGTPLQARHTARPGREGSLGTTERVSELRVTARFGRDAAWGLRLAGDDGERLDLVIRRGRLTIDRGHASRDPRAHVGTYGMPLPQAAPGRTVELRLLLDHTILELFTDSGETLTLRCYPTGDGPWTLLSRGLATDYVAVEVEAHALRPPEPEEEA
uniref:glycoside hydrolase family 32 protein n=1 Tax=Streptomyces sp. SBT349 TaxID=1580539 RepID=UPI00069E9F5E